jgi:HAE1 family hydrophobic/amphiphilic exporter-1
MNLSAIFVKRPVATTLVMIAILAFGLLAFRKLPVSALPNVDFPTIQVSATLPGANADTMSSAIATPLEREFSTIDGVAAMNSNNITGFTSITIQFDLTKPLDSAALDVQAAIARAQPKLPRDLPAPPSYKKVNPADQPIIYLSLASKTVPLYAVNEFAETRLAQIISTIKGVAQVQIFGSQKYAVRVQVDPSKLSSRGIGIDEVFNAIRNANVNVPTGTIWGPNKAFTIQANGQLLDAKAYSRIVVAYRDGAPIRVEDVGTAIDSVENDKTAAWTIDQRAIILGVQKQPGANTVAVSDAVKALLPRFRDELPAAIDLNVLFDRSETVRQSVEDVEYTLLLTLGLVVMVIFLFLRKLSATVIPSLAMPLSIFATFAVMNLLGYSLDNLSLMALTLSVGFVVDDAIVMLENVVRHIEMGKSPFQAALDGSKEIGFTILSMTISLVAVFLPFLFMGGILGRLFSEFAVTIAVCILVSGFVSLSLTPMMGSLFLKEGHAEQGAFYRFVERGFDAMVSVYGRTLSAVLRWKRLTMAFSFAILAATVVLFQRIPKGFLPNEDTDQLFAMTEAVEGVSFDSIKERQKKIAEVVKANPNVLDFMSSVGSRGGIGGPNNGMVFMRLKPRRERTASAPQVIAQLMPKLAEIPGMRVFPQVPPPIRIGGTQTKSEYQLALQGTDTKELYRAAPMLADELSKSSIVKDVTTDLLLKNPELDVTVDRDRAAAYGLSAAQVEDALFTAYGARQASTIYAAQNTYQVILESDPASAREPSALDALYVRSSAGTLVPLRGVADVKQGVGPLAVNHAGQLPP